MEVYNSQYLTTGCKALDNLLQGGIKHGEVTLVYGEHSTGKTSIAIQCACICAKKGLKTLFIDSDNKFSTERLAQIAGSELGKISSKIYIFKPRNFSEQLLLIESLDKYRLDKIPLIVVDTVTTLYRLELDSFEKIFTLNLRLNWQLAYLSELAKLYKISILLTSQVHNVIQKHSHQNKIEPVANRILKFWSQSIIKIEPTSVSTIKEAILEKGHIYPWATTSCLLTFDEKGIFSANPT